MLHWCWLWITHLVVRPYANIVGLFASFPLGPLDILVFADHHPDLSSRKRVMIWDNRLSLLVWSILARLLGMGWFTFPSLATNYCSDLIGSKILFPPSVLDNHPYCALHQVAFWYIDLRNTSLSPVCMKTSFKVVFSRWYTWNLYRWGLGCPFFF